MNVHSLNIRGTPAAGKLESELAKGKILVKQHVEGFLQDARAKHEFSVAGSTFHLIDQGRSVGKAVAGAVIGGALTGGLGLLAGAALGAQNGIVSACTRRTQCSFLNCPPVN